MRVFRRWVKKVIRKLGFEVQYVGSTWLSAPPTVSGPPAVAYRENPEQGAGNLAEKKARVREGGPFEWPNVVALNRAVAGLVGDAGRIVELGAGTGSFAVAAAEVPQRSITCSELDVETSRWAAEHRARSNVRYISRTPTREDGPFDLLVAVELIEHVGDYVGLLRLCVSLAPRAIITTPNRQRGPLFDVPGPPPADKHVREWTAGEFYWVLRCFYRDVRLFGMPDPYLPDLVAIRVTDGLTPLVADCREPLS